ncbi:MAG TPA: acyltransferase family protein, partial [Humisphaera sp.]
MGGVVACHAGFGFTGGYVGVDVFFVLSGFLVTRQILSDFRDSQFSLSRFWERRVRRIVPALALVSAAVLVAGWFVLLPEGYAALGRSLLAMVAAGSNVQFWREAGYFDPAAATKPTLHTWSLSLEGQFYIVLPLALWALARLGGLGRVAWVAGTVALASLALSVVGTARSPTATFFLLPTRAWELLAGSLLSASTGHAGRATRAVREAAAAVGLVLIAVAMAAYNHTTRFPGLAAVPPVVGTMLIVWSGDHACGAPTVTGRLLSARPVVFVGLISYSLYLWHWPLLVLAGEWQAGPLSPTVRAAIVAASVVLAAASWRLVERPFRTRAIAPRRGQAFGLAALAMGAVGGAAWATLATDGFPNRAAFADARRLRETSAADPRFACAHTAADVPDGLTRLGDPADPVELLVWGDSQAESLLPAVDAICRERRVGGRAAVHHATAPTLGYALDSEWGLGARAEPFNQAVVEHIRRAGIKRVLMVAVWDAYLADRADFAAAVVRTVDAVRATGATVYVMRQIPMFGDGIPQMVTRRTARGAGPDDLAAAAGPPRPTSPALAVLFATLEAR